MATVWLCYRRIAIPARRIVASVVAMETANPLISKTAIAAPRIVALVVVTTSVRSSSAKVAIAVPRTADLAQPSAAMDYATRT